MQFFPDDPADLLQTIIGALLGYALMLTAVRIMGLRSFAKMAAHDFAVTVALGSVLASAALADDTPLVVPLIAIATLFVLQFIVSTMRTRSDSIENALSNTPVLLMDGKTILHDNLSKVNVSEDELRGKLREANVTDLDQVMAVVFENTGDVSVLHGDPEQKLQSWLLQDVSRTG